MTKVSVIIPVYNAEKYLGACLDSLLIQTLADFEVIVVDDASTDTSLTVAESYLERFGGRLKIIALPTNTGSGAVPRNEGLSFSRGEYIFFMDNDDLLVETALATLYDFAQAYRAEAVYMERGFLLDANELKAATWNKNASPIAKPTLELNDLDTRIENFLQTNYGWAPWTKFLQRDFLIANKINFPPVRISEDVLWTFKVICLAEKLLRVPNQLYVHRALKSSWSHVKRPPADEIKFWLDPLTKGLDYLEDFMDAAEFFALKPKYRFDVTNFFIRMQVAGMLGALKKISRYELYEIVHGAFHGRHAALIANLFVVMNFYRDKLLEVR